MTKEEIRKDVIERMVKSGTAKKLAKISSWKIPSEMMDMYAQQQSLDFSRWLAKNNWHYYEELDFFYQMDYKTNKEKQETGLTLYEFFCWMNDEVNPFIKLENGRYCQACGNSTTWSYDELFEMFKKENNHE